MVSLGGRIAMAHSSYRSLSIHYLRGYFYYYGGDHLTLFAFSFFGGRAMERYFINDGAIRYYCGHLYIAMNNARKMFQNGPVI